MMTEREGRSILVDNDPSDGVIMVPAQLELLRRLALNDETALGQAMTGEAITSEELDVKTSTLVKLAGLVALEAGETSYQWAVAAAHAAGAEDGEIVDVLLAVASIVGTARLNVAAPRLALALGHDIGDGELGEGQPGRP